MKQYSAEVKPSTTQHKQRTRYPPTNGLTFNSWGATDYYIHPEPLVFSPFLFACLYFFSSSQLSLRPSRIITAKWQNNKMVVCYTWRTNGPSFSQHLSLLLPLHSQVWSSSHFSCGLTSNITSPTVWRTWLFIAYRRWKNYTTNSHYFTCTFLFTRLKGWENVRFWTWEWKSKPFISLGPVLTSAFSSAYLRVSESGRLFAWNAMRFPSSPRPTPARSCSLCLAGFPLQ